MTAAEYVIRVVEALERLGIPFMIVGSMSSNVYGVPRSTKDADFVIQLGDQNVSALAAASRFHPLLGISGSPRPLISPAITI